MAKKIKTRLGADGYSYPYTHEDLICNNEGTSLSQKLASFATKDYVNNTVADASIGGGIDTTGFALKTDIPTKTSQLTNDSNFLTNIPGEYITETELNAKGYLTSHQDISGKADISYVDNKVANLVDSAPEALNTLNELAAALKDDPSHTETMLAEIGKKANTADLKPVATSGSYNDLSNKPTIPTVTNDLTNTLKSNYDAAYTHSQAAHAPSNAQKNSDITKQEIENKLTGNITSHTHNYLSSVPDEYVTDSELTAKGYATQSYVDNKLAGLSIVQITKAEYDALGTKDSNTLYLVTE